MSKVGQPERSGRRKTEVAARPPQQLGITLVGIALSLSDICAVSTGVSTKTEDAFVSTILSGHYIVWDLLRQVVLEVIT